MQRAITYAPGAEVARVVVALVLVAALGSPQGASAFNLALPKAGSGIELDKVTYVDEATRAPVTEEQAKGLRCVVTVSVILRPAVLRTCRGLEKCQSIQDVYSQQWFDPGERPRLDEKGIHGWVSSWKRPEGKTLRYFGVDRKAATDAYGVAEVRFELDKEANLVSESFFGLKDERVASKSGVHRVAFGQRRKLLSRVRFFGPEGQPAVDAAGAHEERVDPDTGGIVAYGLDRAQLPGPARSAGLAERVFK